uniref:Uncharacterized protein n=1 Tax=Taenia asiatica TaxID=60517 RepID=A0A0R3WB88_TAEAS
MCCMSSDARQNRLPCDSTQRPDIYASRPTHDRPGGTGSANGKSVPSPCLTSLPPDTDAHRESPALIFLPFFLVQIEICILNSTDSNPSQQLDCSSLKVLCI